MGKDFDELTIADDYMFYRVMEDIEICKSLLNMVLQEKIGIISDIELQKAVDDGGKGKGVRFDVWAKDCNGHIYDIEMQATDKKDLEKRVRYYQAAIDVSLLGKSRPYESLPDTFILFFCTFDYLEKGLPVYTFKTICNEDNRIALDDGITKMIINSKAAEYEQNEKLKVFLEYMNGKTSDDEFIQKIERRIKEVKANERLRREYMLANELERDARYDGWKAGKIEGMRQKALETAKNLLQVGLSIENIAKATGLTVQEVQDL